MRAVLCHPMRAVSLESRTELYGNDIMNPPRCAPRHRLPLKPLGSLGSFKGFGVDIRQA